jgi:hypothetical protein
MTNFKISKIDLVDLIVDEKEKWESICKYKEKAKG